MESNVQLVDVPDTASAMLHPVRSRLLERFAEPRSAAEVARELGLPRQRVGHHVRLLREQGLLVGAGERRNGNFVEQLLQATARVYVIAPQALGGAAGDPEALRDRFSSDYLVASAARTIRDVATLRRKGDESGKKIATMTLETEVCFADPQQQAAFAEDVARSIAGVAARYHDEQRPGGRRFRLTLGCYPACPPDPETKSEEERDES